MDNRASGGFPLNAWLDSDQALALAFLLKRLDDNDFTRLSVSSRQADNMRSASDSLRLALRRIGFSLK